MARKMAGGKSGAGNNGRTGSANNRKPTASNHSGKTRASRQKRHEKSPALIRAQKRQWRMRLLCRVSCLFLIGLLVRIGYLKVTYGDEYERRAVTQLILNKNSTEKEIMPNRGYILDRNKQPLATSSRVYNIILDVTVLDSIKPTATSDPKKETLAKLHELLEIPMATLEGYFAKDVQGNLIKPNNYCIVARQVPASVALQLKDLRCVYPEEDTLRRYNEPDLAPQVIGFQRGDALWGLENSYNTALSGVKGRTFRTYDQDNNPVTEDIPSQDGYWLITTLDAGIQRIAQRAVDNAAATYACAYAAMLFMDPNTGEVLAMAQWPSFSLTNPDDFHLFTDAQIAADWDMLTAEKQMEKYFNTWGNYHLTKTFEPGSIFKPIVVAAALEENIINPGTDHFYCGGDVQVYDTRLPCWNTNGHGGQNIVEVLANSCNVAMIDIVQRLGKNLFYKYRSDFGYGEKTDIDLPGEASVSSPYVMYTLSQLNPVELATSSFGQGFNNTAIQAITAFSALINGGNLMKPYIVSQIVDDKGNIVKENTPTVVRKVISGETSDFLREAMHAVVQPSGTGRRAVIEGYHIGGKTGTAQQGKREEGNYTVSFMAYLPVEKPEVIALAIIDRPVEATEGSVSAAPMLREALLEVIQYKNMQPAAGDTLPDAVTQPIGNAGVLGDYSGKQLVEVTRNLNNLNVDYQISGSGTIVKSHIPAAGQPIPNGTPIFLYLDSESVRESEMTYVPNVVGMQMEHAETQVTEALLTPVTFKDKTGTTAEPASEQPVSHNADGGTTASSAAQNGESTTYIVYKQFPAAGAYVQKGTEIKLKVRPE